MEKILLVYDISHKCANLSEKNGKTLFL